MTASISAAPDPVSTTNVRDLVTTEIFARKLYSVAEEMGRTMIRTSGDPVIAEANDFSTVVTDANGELLASAYLTFHLGAARQTIRHLLDTIPADDIHPGDAWICNDPHTTGACHAPDLGIVRPIFAGDELLAWCWSEAHMMDIGGMAPGGFAPHAYECYAEGLRFPGIKIVSRGVIINDIWRLIETNFRVPDRNLNEIRCFIAACNTADSRIADIVDEYGVEGFKNLAEAAKQLTEDAAKRRIASLPDGVYVHRDWVEHNGHVNDLYEIVCTATVDGEKLTFDFTGTSPQTDGFINVAHGSALAAAVTPIFMTLVPDVPINEGLIRVLDFVFPRGTIVNPVMPAPTSSGHMETGLRVNKVVAALMGRMQGASDDPYVRDHVMAPFHDGVPLTMLYAPNEEGEWIPFLDLDAQSGGSGAQPSQDGMDACGPTTCLNNKLPDLEVYEHQNPVLFLWRRLNIGSAGLGRQHGGLGIHVAWMPWRTPGGQATAISACQQVPAPGLFGGYPGTTSGFTLAKGARADELLRSGTIPSSFESLDGEITELESKSFGIAMEPGDILWMHSGGGGGFGDPLRREAADVATEVRDRYLTPDLAAVSYGVRCTELGELDEAATEALRQQMREERRQWPVAEPLGAITAPTGERISLSPALSSVGGVPVCATCDSPLAAAGDDFRRHAPSRRRSAAEALASTGGWAQPRDDVFIEEFACHHCADMLHVEVTVPSEPE
jgi:N-methylhydantoinase B